ncbi:MAG: TetR/AcrR family transcriptional regulator [Nakamurella sp.]
MSAQSKTVGAASVGPAVGAASVGSTAAAISVGTTGGGIRERARRELTAAIKALARQQLATSGADCLSLRAIARELDMASSAIYRYFASRDELLTALVIDAYNDLGAAAEDALAASAGQPAMSRWVSVCRAVRTWGLNHQHEYGLIYGTPVPGYRAPRDTVAPAGRAVLALVEIIVNAHEQGIARPPNEAVPAAISANMARLRNELGIPLIVGDGVMTAMISMWAGLFGLVSFELFGQFHGIVDVRDDFFDHSVTRLGRSVGIPD